VSELSIRRSGLAAIVAALLLVFTFFLGERLGLSESYFIVFGLLVLLSLLAALPGLRAAQKGRDGALGMSGYWIAVIAITILSILFAVAAFAWLALAQDPEEALPGWLEVFLPIGFVGTVLGLLIFGIGAIRANVLPRWGAILFTIGLPLGLAIDIATGAFFEENGTTPEVGFYVGPPLFAIGLIWLGYALWSRTGMTPHTST
jgi:hypothetical protein